MVSIGVVVFLLVYFRTDCQRRSCPQTMIKATFRSGGASPTSDPSEVGAGQGEVGCLRQFYVEA